MNDRWRSKNKHKHSRQENRRYRHAEYVKQPCYPPLCDAAILITEDSMAPLYIENDVVFIHCQDCAEDGSVVAIANGDNCYIRYIYYTPEHVILRRANVESPPTIYTWEDFQKLRIIGKAIGFQRWTA